MNKLGYTQLIDKKFEMDKKAKIHDFQQGRHDHSLFNTIFSVYWAYCWTTAVPRVLKNFSTHYYSTEYLGNKDKKNYFEIGKCKWIC